MVDDFCSSWHFQLGSVCCEVVLFRAKSRSLESGARYSDFGITFQRGTCAGNSLEVFAVADYASKATDRRSISGGVIMCGGECECWFSRTQKCVITLSTAE